jgi:alkanesulfonate monooxygenase SsuD/methylene tetrahydromethanopterin reductase-like flavin-dependent oxidoreductase (luciferase family)
MLAVGGGSNRRFCTNPDIPLQRPHPPILIGGNGRSLLALAAREADIVGLSG